MKTKITWFRHHHENRNDLLRFSLMRLHYQGEVHYTERPFTEAGNYGFSKAVTTYPDPRHLSFLLVQNNKTTIRCLVDNEDSFALISPLIKEVDVVFCAGYNSDFFEKKQFVNPYAWQDDTDLAWYKNTIERKIQDIGPHFHKIKKFVPIAPNLANPLPLSGWKRKYRNLEHKLNRIIGKGNQFADDYKGFELRYAHLQELRNKHLQYDVVLNDSLWGWPNHRINLHRQLQSLHMKGYKVHSILKWNDPVEHDGSVIKTVDPHPFPLKTLPIDQNYELMLAQSRLAVFACGFHWGWRNIMMFALMTGIPVLTDRLLTEAYFDMNEFQFFQQEDHGWDSVEEHLKTIDEEKWKSIKTHNQAVYDKYMNPEQVGHYFLSVLN
jgi:hypothetical protein